MNLGNKKKSKSKESERKNKHKKALFNRTNENLIIEDNEINNIQDDLSIQGETSDDNVAISVVPFSDGIVDKGISLVITKPFMDIKMQEICTNFLEHYSIYGFACGNITNKTSFMKKKGAILL